MADLTMCNSSICKARELCRRNETCPSHYPVDERRQSWAGWHPTAGQSCPGFIDARGDWTRRGHDV